MGDETLECGVADWQRSSLNEDDADDESDGE